MSAQIAWGKADRLEPASSHGVASADHPLTALADSAPRPRHPLTKQAGSVILCPFVLKLGQLAAVGCGAGQLKVASAYSRLASSLTALADVKPRLAAASIAALNP